MQLPLVLKTFMSAQGHANYKVLEEINPLVVGFLESTEYSLSMLCCEAVSYRFFCFLDPFLEPASIPCNLFPGSLPILLAAYVILSNFLKEGHLENTSRKALAKHSHRRSLVFICTRFYF